MRRRASKEGRTTLYIVDRKLWQEAKKAAANRRNASVSEVVFDAIKTSIHDAGEVDFLRAIEKRTELAHFTVGAISDACRMTRGETMERMTQMGFSIDEPDLESMRKEVHKRLRMAGVVPREELILPTLVSNGQPGLEALKSCFGASWGEYASELQLTWDSIWQATSESREMRSWFEESVDSSAKRKVEELLERLSLADQDSSLPGPKDWHYSLLYLAAVGLAFGQARLLKEYFESQSHAQFAILSWLTGIRAEAQEIWGPFAHTPAFRSLWGVVTREKLDALPSAPAVPIPEISTRATRSGDRQGSITRGFVMMEEALYPVDIATATLPEGLRQSLLRTARDLHVAQDMRAKGFPVLKRVEETLTEDIDPGGAQSSSLAYTRSLKIEVNPNAGTH